MLTLTIKLIVYTIADQWFRFQQALAAMGAQRRCAMSLDAVGDRLLRMGGKINYLRMQITDGHVAGRVDSDGSLRGSLKGLKEDIRDIRRQLAGLQPPEANVRLQRAFARLSKIAEETYAAADRLQWQIEEYERDMALRRP